MWKHDSVALVRPKGEGNTDFGNSFNLSVVHAMPSLLFNHPICNLHHRRTKLLHLQIDADKKEACTICTTVDCILSHLTIRKDPETSPQKVASLVRTSLLVPSLHKQLLKSVLFQITPSDLNYQVLCLRGNFATIGWTASMKDRLQKARNGQQK